MLKLEFCNLKKSIVDTIGRKKIEITPGMEYISTLINGPGVFHTEDIDYSKFSLEDMDRFRSLLEDMEYVNKQNIKLYKDIAVIKPKMGNRVTYI